MDKQFYRLWISALFLLTFILGGCRPATQTPAPSTPTLPPATATVTASPLPTATQTASPIPTQTASPTPAPIVIGPTGFPADVNPLTGLQVSDPRLLDRRPVLIKVSNYPREGRPHAGLSFADIVFDYYIGEGTNRFLALYYGQDAPKVGPIRSGRLADVPLVRWYQGIFGYSGADLWTVNPYIVQNLGNRAITQAPATCPALCDDGPHTVLSVFADTARLSQYAVEKRNTSVPGVKANLEGMFFDSRLPQSGEDASGLTVIYNIQNIGEWRFDPQSGRYLRWIETVDPNGAVSMTPLLDRLTGEQLSFANVVVMFAAYTEYAPTLHEISLWYNWNGSRAVLYRDGKAIEGVWKHVSTDRPPQFFTPAGQPLAFKPGNTWVVITGTNSKLEQVKTGQWEMHFYLP